MHALTSTAGRRARPILRLAALVLAGAFGVTLVPPSADAGGNVRFLADGGQSSKPTRAWIQFCADQPAACQVGALEPRAIAHTPQLWRDLGEVNRAVNREIVARTDFDQWGVSDRWDFPDTGYGDCEDIQIEKRRRLIALGYPARAMRMAVVINPEGEGHAVLVVRSDRGDFVLDNRTDQVLPWYAARYTWVKRESDDGSDRWVALGGIRSPVETAGDRR